jgi:hypothetical protein
MQHLEGSGTPVLYIGRTVLKGHHGKAEVLEKNISPAPTWRNVMNVRYALGLS